LIPQTAQDNFDNPPILKVILDPFPYLPASQGLKGDDIGIPLQHPFCGAFRHFDPNPILIKADAELLAGIISRVAKHMPSPDPRITAASISDEISCFCKKVMISSVNSGNDITIMIYPINIVTWFSRSC